MKKKRMIISIVLALSMLIGAVVAIVMNQPDESIVNPDNSDTAPSVNAETPQPEQMNNTTVTPEQPSVDNAPTVLPDFDEGNEQLLDMNLIDYLAAMERGDPMTDEHGNYMISNDGNIIYQGGDEDTVNSILDVLVLLVNHFANEGYSKEANQQVQRLYFAYYELFGSMTEKERYSKLSFCIPATGAVATELSRKAEEALGVTRTDAFAFVFESIPYEGKQPKFFNVKLTSFDLQDLEEFCLYSSLKNAQDKTTERNLEAWLHNIVRRVNQAGLSSKHIQLAQILYANALANATYTANWGDLLIECLTIEDLTYNNFKTAVNAKFGADILGNTALREFFTANFEEVTA